MGGIPISEQGPKMSETQNPGHSTSVLTQRWKHMGTRPPNAMGSSLDCGTVHRGKIEEQCIDMKLWKHILYIVSEVFPTFDA